MTNRTRNGFLPPVLPRKDDLSAGVIALLVVAFIVLVVLIALLGGVITQFAWNYGVVALVAAAGGSLGKIGLVTAIAANLAISIVGRIFRAPRVPDTSSK